MKLTKEQAFNLLIDGLEEPMKIQYVTHCLYVGKLAGLIAEGIGSSGEFATVLGFLHDIGRKINPADHQYVGFLYLKTSVLSVHEMISKCPQQRRWRIKRTS